jgi:hypothetical protein
MAGGSGGPVVCGARARARAYASSPAGGAALPGDAQAIAWRSSYTAPMPLAPSLPTTLRMLAALEQAGDLGLHVAELTQKTWGVKPTAGYNRVAGAMICTLVDDGLASRHGRRHNALHWITPAGSRFLAETRRRAAIDAEERAARRAIEPPDPQGAGPFLENDE